MSGRRRALIVANEVYDNAGLRRLKSPAADARALARVLADPDIGGFTVQVVLDELAHTVEAQVEDLFADSLSDDLVLLHFSCHGLKSDAGELFFAMRNTRPDRLGSTSVAADFVQRCIKTCRAKSIVLFLDCCYGGAFGQGVSVRAGGSAHVLDAFPAGKMGGGRGRAVITASSAMEYAFEGDRLTDEQQQRPSVFTSALVEGLDSGDADRDEDGLVSLNELYEYVFDKVREQNPNQTPSRDVEVQGELYLARSPRRRVRPLPIPPEVQTALRDANMFTRLGAVSELRGRLLGADLAAALGARAALVELSHTDIGYIEDAAAQALAGAAVGVSEDALDFGRVVPGSPGPSRTLQVTGPPIARACTYSASDGWIHTKATPGGVVVSLDVGGAATGRADGSITVHSAGGGELTVPVTVEVLAATVADTAKTRKITPVPDAAREADVNRDGVLTWAGWLAVAAGVLMFLALWLPFRYDGTTHDEQPELFWFLLVISVVMTAGGALALSARAWGWLGPGIIVGGAACSTWGLSSLGQRVSEMDGLQVGVFAHAAAHLMQLAAAGLAVSAVLRVGQVRAERLSRHDRSGWLVVLLGAAGAALMAREAADIWPSYQWVGAETAWFALLAVLLPTAAVLLRPGRLGLSLLLGWLAGAAAVAGYYWLTLEAYDSSLDRAPAFACTLLAIAVVAALRRWHIKDGADESDRVAGRAAGSG